MNTKQINLLVFDTSDNFQRSKKYLGEEGSNFKRIICIESFTEFEHQFNTLADEELIFLVVHVFYTDGISGIRKFKSSGILKQYPKIGTAYISDGDRKKIQHDMLEHEFPVQNIFKYHDIQEYLEDGRFQAFTKREIVKLTDKPFPSVTAVLPTYPQFDYAVLIALYKDEFEELNKVFDFPDDEVIKTEKKHYHVGYLKTDKTKKIIASVQTVAGMIDSAIIATHMLELFRPKYLLMSGVCGGSEDYQFGDVIIAQQIFTFQKGKISDVLAKNESGDLVKLELFNKQQEIIDYDHLYDRHGNQITISIEKFEPDNDAAAELDSAIIDSLRPKMENICSTINATIKKEAFFSAEKVIKVELAPMACSTMVINKNGYFEDTIKSVNRKTAAVEMESFGVARACKFANHGQTKFLIFKSVMDHTAKKTDTVGGVNWKKFAAFTSAQFLKCIFEENVI